MLRLFIYILSHTTLVSTMQLSGTAKEAVLFDADSNLLSALVSSKHTFLNLSCSWGYPGEHQFLKSFSLFDKNLFLSIWKDSVSATCA